MFNAIPLLQSGAKSGLVIGLLGELLWLITYLLIIRKGFRDDSYGLPLVAICTNFSWELYIGFICPASSACRPVISPECLCPAAQGIGLWVARIWCFVDLFIVYQLLSKCRKEQLLVEVRRFFYLIAPLTFGLALVGQVLFISYYRDLNGTVDAWMINMIMAVLFVFMLFTRRPKGCAGLSYAAGWTRLAADLLIAAGLVALDSVPTNPQGESGFVIYLMVVVLGFDVLYVTFFSIYRRHEAGAVAAA